MASADSSTGRVLGALAASIALHALITAGVRSLPPRQRPPPGTMLEVAVVDAKAPAKPEPTPEAPKKQPPVRLARAPKQPPPLVAAKKALPPDDAPPPPSIEAKEPQKAPIETGITLESTASQGTMTVGVGNTLYGTPSTTAKDPASVKPYKAARYAPVAAVTELPSIRERPNLRQYYPEEARRKDFEGDVVLRIVIDDDGTVVKAEVVSDPGEGLGAAAIRAVTGRRIFNPAKQNGLAVATTIPNFVLHFQLD